MTRTKFYDVLIIPARPACTDHGVVYDIEATSKAAAIKQARERIRREMTYDRHDGKLLYTATETN
jgi:hypothetical protein